MVDEKLMTSVRYLSEEQKEDFQKKIVGKTTARFVFTDAVEAYRATGETAGRLLVQRNEAMKGNKELRRRVFNLEAALDDAYAQGERHEDAEAEAREKHWRLQ